ncbi:hypothetical protein [Halarchaeum sp. P4]|uniref:hypothetical protein n=1 Tax=Halarchaeum sp. P4 TaxID=3421639 RepID=UPI003EBF44BF
MVCRRRALLCCVLLVAGLAVVATPTVARPPPQPVSGFGGFDGGTYAPGEYPPSDATNVSVDVAVHANGTSVWTERATLTNSDTAAAFRSNDSLRRAVVAHWFDDRFDRETTHLASRVANDTLVVTYRLGGVVTRGVGGGVLFAPFADYRNDYYPGAADVTIHAPEGYRVVSHPDEMRAVERDTLRWGADGHSAGVSPGLVTFAPAGAALPSARADLAVLAAYGPATVGVGLAWALLFGLPLGLVLSGGVRLVRDDRRTVRRVALATPLLVGLVVAVAQYPATGSTTGGAFGRVAFSLGVPVALVVALLGLGIHGVARRHAP